MRRRRRTPPTIYFVNYHAFGSKIQTTDTRDNKNDAMKYGTELLRKGYIVSVVKARNSPFI